MTSALCLTVFVSLFSVIACSQTSNDTTGNVEKDDDSLIGASATGTEDESEPTLDEASDGDVSQDETLSGESGETEFFGGEEGESSPPKGCDKKKIFFKDNDHDGYGDPGLPQKFCFPNPPFVNNNTDCNDSNPQVHPNRKDCTAIWQRTFFGECVLETVANGIDNDCDGQMDEDLECGNCSPPSEPTLQAPPPPPPPPPPHLDSPTPPPEDSTDENPP